MPDLVENIKEWDEKNVYNRTLGLINRSNRMEHTLRTNYKRLQAVDTSNFIKTTGVRKSNKAARLERSYPNALVF